MSLIDKNSKEFELNYKSSLELICELKKIEDKVKQGGNTKPDPRKIPVREKINLLIDKGSSFFELSRLAGYNLYDGIDTPSGGIITGIGLIHSKACMIIANDPSVKAGSYFPISLKKHLRAQEIAYNCRLTTVYLVDSAGAYLPMQDEVFADKNHFGRIFFNEAKLSAQGIVQIASVHGLCTAGGAYIPAMSDYSIMVENQGHIFLAGPPLVKEATGEEVSSEDLGGSRVHARYSGVCDFVACDDSQAICKIRDIIRYIKYQKPEFSPDIISVVEPKYDPDEILGFIPNQAQKNYDMDEIILRIVDSSYFEEYRKDYGPEIICAFSHIGGFPVGIIANRGVIFSASALKATNFMELCEKQQIPLVFLQNTTGFMVGSFYEKEGISKNGAKMVQAVASLTVPKISIIVGSSYGAGNYGMCGRAYDPDFLFIWPGSKIGVMGASQAGGVMASIKEAQLKKKGQTINPEKIEKIRSELMEKYRQQESSYYSTARLWDDGIIDPRSSRDVIIKSLAICYQHRRKPRNNNSPIFRM